MALLHLTLLGGFAARVSAEQPVRISSRKNQALLAFLALTPGRRHARERLVDLFWGEGDNEHGRNSLRQALTALRKDLAEIDPTPLVVDGEILAVAPEAIDVDVLMFERLAQAEDAGRLKQAAAFYRGDLLEGLALGETGFEEWLQPERSRLREVAIDVLTRLVPKLPATESVEAARDLVALDPLRDTSQRLLIAVLADRDQDALALRQYRLYSEVLERELGLQPAAATQALHRAIAGGGYRKSEPIEDETPNDNRRDKPVIAVLPFENRSSNPQNLDFCTTLAGDIADALSRVASFTVTARGATARYRGPIDSRRPGAELGAAYVVQGSVLRQGERLRISAQVCDAVTGHHVWADQYDCTSGDVFEAQELITKAIAASAETQIMLAARHRVPQAAPDGMALRDLIARGISLLYDETADSLDEALALGERAVVLAPGDPRAHQLLADATVQRLAARTIAYDPALVARGVDLARTAVGMAPGNEWTHLTLARSLIEAGRLDAAIAEAERALEINPSSVIAVARLSECYALLGRSDEAIAASRSALQLDPRGPESYQRHFTMGLAHFCAGKDAEACDEAGQVARWQPGYTRAYLLLAAASAAFGRKPEAGAAIARCLERYPDLRVADAMPRVMPSFARAVDRSRLAEMLRAAGLPGEST